MSVTHNNFSCFHIDLPPEICDKLEDLREQNPHYTQEQILMACCAFGVNWFLEDRQALTKMRQWVWRQSHLTRHEMMVRVGARLLSGRLTVPSMPTFT